MKFVSDQGFTKLQMDVADEATLDEVTEAFTDFLRGCGYSFDGRVDIVGDDELAEYYYDQITPEFIG